MREPIYELNNVCFGYDDIPVLEDVNLTINKADYVGILGENGAGKTTLLRLLTGEVSPVSGEIFLFSEKGLSKRSLQKIGYVPQINPAMDQAFPLTCYELVSLGLLSTGRFPFRIRKSDRKKIDFSLRHLGVEHLANENFYSLSGGQKQRVLIAKAMVHNPEILIFDEPTVGIDEKSKIMFFQILDHMNTVHDITIIMVTHERDLGQEHWNRILEVDQRKVVISC